VLICERAGAWANGVRAFFVLPATTPGQVTGGGSIFSIASNGVVSFGFNARSDGTDVRGNCNLIDHASKTKIKCLNVTTLVMQTSRWVTLFGQATIDGVTTNYRLDAEDYGEPGGVDDTFTFQTDNGYFAGGRSITGGNIQIHR
jgi:hypothetical protein